MRPLSFVLAAVIATFALIGSAQESGPYKVLKRARVGGEGGWDYIYADAAGRRLYIPRGATRAVAATATAPEVPAIPKRLTIFNLDTLEPAGEIPGRGRKWPCGRSEVRPRLHQQHAQSRCSIPKR